MLGYDAKMGAYTQLFAGLSPVLAKEYRDGLWGTVCVPEQDGYPY